MKLLEREGLVELINWREAFVRKISQEATEELYTTLRLFDGALTGMAARKMTDSAENELHLIIGLLDNAFAKKDKGKSIDASKRFHDFIIRVSGNHFIIKFRQYLKTHEERFRHTSFLTSGYMTDIYHEHRNIVKALLNPDPFLAERLMEEHIDNTQARVMETLRRQHEDAGGCARFERNCYDADGNNRKQYNKCE